VKFPKGWASAAPLPASSRMPASPTTAARRTDTLVTRGQADPLGLDAIDRTLPGGRGRLRFAASGGRIARGGLALRWMASSRAQGDREGATVLCRVHIRPGSPRRRAPTRPLRDPGVVVVSVRDMEDARDRELLGVSAR
jgi:hypothetical protein